MAQSKPYYRIARPKAYIPDYATDKRYASDRIQLSRAYINIEHELREIFNYIEPDERNLKAFSLKLYSLLLRACTEVELNCKLIMEANGAKSIGNNFTMNDYIKLEKSSKLTKYIVTYRSWKIYNYETKEIQYITKDFEPFKSFGGDEPKSPKWYQDYNDVKHNREGELTKANFENCLNAVAAILILLNSQFGASCIETYGSNDLYWSEVGAYDLRFAGDVIFDMIIPGLETWTSDELYEFDWSKLSGNDEPFAKYDFNSKKYKNIK